VTFDSYIKGIEKNLSLGNATEHTHRAALATLLESLEPGLTATNEPKRMTDVGAPDYILTRGSVPLGYVEAKDVGVDLRRTERTDQLKRYKAALPNLILTDYLEFRHFVDGEHRGTVRIAEEDSDGKLRVDKAGVVETERLLRSFLATVVSSVGTPQELAERMAARAREIRDLIVRTFEGEGEKGQLHQQLSAFRKTLIPDLQRKAFADMYAQTIAYGLFAARTTTDNSDTFSRKTAGWDLPRTNPFLRNLFNEIAGPGLDERVAWIVDDLAELLRRADMAAILEDFGHKTRQEDPVVHFYETFLAAYDPKMRESRGVYYTPEPVVSYIVRSVDAVLKEKFGRPLGLADPNALILDPATGTATFLYYVIRHIYEELQKQGQLGAWSSYVRESLLPRIFGFELLMAPYTVAHMKLGILLGELGYDVEGDERLRVYLTNTLEEGFHPEETIGFAEYITQEADAAARVKKDEPIEVIIGNPPYSGHSANKGKWISGLIDTYKRVDGKPLGERNPKWLNDDYVKFIRFGQWRVEKTGQGILAFITNHGYVDNPTFRGMRQSLMQTFTDIYLIDLHGNSLKKEKSPEEGRDENVFDIQQGVSIGIFIREDVDKIEPAKVHHVDLWGARADKYEWLASEDAASTEWTELAPSSPSYLFAPQDMDLVAEYEQGWKLTHAMPVNAIGMNSHRDSFAVSFEIGTMEQRIEDLVSADLEDEQIKVRYKLADTSDFNLSRARRSLRRSSNPARLATSCLYRPFDYRYVLYHSEVLDRLRTELNSQFVERENLGLVTTRQTREPFAVLAVDRICGQHKIVAKYDGSYISPLYLYPTNDNLLDMAEEGRRPNLSPEFTRDLSERLGLEFVPDGNGDLSSTFGPEDVFHYAYAVFHSPTYRERYAEFLKRDFPRLPLTSDRTLFTALVGKGADLVGLHLMTSPVLDRLITRFPEGGDNVVEKVRYDATNGRVYINNAQHFEGVREEVWGFRVGGYQVLDKWLKDRKGRALSFGDIRHYQRVVVVLSETRRLMLEIDETIPGWPMG
jgi:predicted helicase